MKNQIIVAMDMEISEGKNLMLKIEKYPEIQKMIYGYKVGSLWVLERGIGILEEVQYELTRHIGSKLILDMQKWGTDIPDIIIKQVNKVSPYVDELICAPFGAGSESLKTFSETCFLNNVKPISVVKMTHPNSDVYLKDGYALNIAKDSTNCNIKTFVIPATKEPKSMKLLFGLPSLKDSELYTTGLKVQGGQVKSMIDVGVTKFIVGRAIYEAEDPIKIIEDTYKEINGE